jgi:hypothetical protein
VYKRQSITISGDFLPNFGAKQAVDWGSAPV